MATDKRSKKGPEYLKGLKDVILWKTFYNDYQVGRLDSRGWKVTLGNHPLANYLNDR